MRIVEPTELRSHARKLTTVAFQRAHVKITAGGEVLLGRWFEAGTHGSQVNCEITRVSRQPLSGTSRIAT